jgi:glycosyltransferase involved in cell wall biosynthesis
VGKIWERWKRPGEDDRTVTAARITAIIPTFNSRGYIRDTVESVLGQTYPVHEVIVVDDGSTDGTEQVLASYAGRVRYIRQQNAGPPAARNNGVAHATGDWVALLDSDDLWVRTKIERQMEYLEVHPDCGLIYTDMKTFDDTGVIEESVKVSRNLTLPSGHIFPQMFAETLFQTSAVMIRKSCLDAVGGFDETLRMGDDYELFLRIARHFELGYIDMPLVLYRQHPTQGTRTWGKQLQHGVPWEALVLKKITNLYPEIFEELGRHNIQRRLSKPYVALAYACFAEGDHRNARQLTRQALRYWPSNFSYLRYYLMTFLSPRVLNWLRAAYDKSHTNSASAGNAENTMARWHSSGS